MGKQKPFISKPFTQYKQLQNQEMMGLGDNDFKITTAGYEVQNLMENMNLMKK